MKKRAKPKFRVGQVVCINTDQPRYRMVILAKQNEEWVGGYFYMLAEEGAMRYSCDFLRAQTKREAGQ